MSRQIMVPEVLSKLSQLGISCVTGQGADITINCEFLDAGWGAGNKKISYEASAFFDESSQTVFLWEMTKESGSGFSFGGSSESSFQSGTTLFRKVKSVQYGPDGKAYEYNLDLGAIPKAFKEVAKQYSWKFKTVLKRDKATCSDGYKPVVNQQQGNANVQSQVPPVMPGYSQPTIAGSRQNQGGTGAVPPPPPPQQQYNPPQQQYSYTQAPQQQYSPPQQQYNNPQGAFYAQDAHNKPKGKTRMVFWVMLIILMIFDILLYAGGSGVIFLALAAVVLVFMFALRKSISKGFFKTIFFFVIAFVVTFIVFAFTGTGIYIS